jgi:UDP-N-acetylglucosamine--N-acetylmuramyl-(pentapeptide) pyrophosphoryl-undecaprenol N-acetylglucosamine transferase
MTDIQQPKVLFAGGGSGGHLYPALAVAEQLQAINGGFKAHFVCSARPLDRQILEKAEMHCTPLAMRGMPRRWLHWPGFLLNYLSSRMTASRLMRRVSPHCVVATGGFVSGPVVMAARRRGVPVVLLNLDAVPGKANRLLMPHCDRVLSVYDHPSLGGVTYERVAVPLPNRSIGPADGVAARRQLGFDPDRPLLLITGGSQGAQSINRMMMALSEVKAFQQALDGWQVLHLAGPHLVNDVQQAYLSHRIEATVLAFSDQMGLCWAGADLAISRGGANTVAEVAANRTPTIFLPYPYHADDHQHRNVQPLVDGGGACVVEDRVDPGRNIETLQPILEDLLKDEPRRRAMSRRLGDLDTHNGARDVAGIVEELCRD